MTPNDKKRRGLFLTIGLFILPFQLVINHFYGGITVKSFIVILFGWLISIDMLFLVFRSTCRR